MSRRFSHGYALLIGVTENRVPHWSLPQVAGDIQALKGVLLHPERCAYLKENVLVLTGTDATRQGILDGLAWLGERLRADAGGNATAVIYYSGHGLRDRSSPPNYFLIPYDAGEDDLHSRALPARDLAGAIDALRPQRLLVLLDCCHAGGMGVKELPVFSAGLTPAAFPPALLMGGEEAFAGPDAGAKGLEALSRGRGRAVLSSSTGEQRSYLRRDGKMSIFTYHLIEALTGYARPAGGATEVLVSDVMGHVWRRVPESARAEWNAEQTPDYLVGGNFPVALLLGGKGVSSEYPAPDPLEAAEPGKAYHIHTGGGPYIAGSVHVEGDFVGRDRYEVYIAGDGNVVGPGSGAAAYKPSAVGITVQEFLALLEEVRRVLEASGLERETAAAVEGDLRTAEEQARSGRPRGAIILGKLKAAAEVLKTAAAGASLISLVEKALAWAQQLFR